MATSYFIAKLYRQHKSVVMVVPRPVQVALGLKAGEHVVLQWKNPEGTFEFKKFVLAGEKDAGSTEHVNQQDKSRETPAKDGG